MGGSGHKEHVEMKKSIITAAVLAAASLAVSAPAGAHGFGGGGGGGARGGGDGGYAASGYAPSSNQNSSSSGLTVGPLADFAANPDPGTPVVNLVPGESTPDSGRTYGPATLPTDSYGG